MQQGGSSRGQGWWSGCTVTGYEKAHIKVGLGLARQLAAELSYPVTVAAACRAPQMLGGRRRPDM